MKLLMLIGCMVVSILAQLFVLQGWHSEMLTANILLAFFVMASLYSTREQLLWIALACGLFSDFYSSVDFGFYLGFYLLLAIVCKYLFAFGESDHSSWRLLLVLVMASSLQAISITLPIILQGWNKELFFNIAWFVGTTALAGGVWYLILNTMNDYLKKLPKFSR